MDVLKPELLTIDGICYRLNPGNYSRYLDKNIEQQHLEYDEVPYEDCSEGEEDIFEIEGGRFKTSFHVPKSYFPYIIGAKGATKKRLEIETRSKIVIPKLGHDGHVVITAASKKGVASAKRRIRLMLMTVRKRQAFSHFLSIPFNDPSIQSAFLNFKKEVLDNIKTCGVDESIFQAPERLHLTLGLMFLSDEVERKEAATALEKCKEIVTAILQDNSLKIVMSGVEYMNDDPSEVDVLYGKVYSLQNEYLLQEVVDAIIDFFSKKGIIEKKTEHVKLHVTLMNTTFRSTESDKKTPRETFDATDIISKYRDYFFGEMLVSRIELSVRHSFSKTGYYQSSAFISLP